MEFPLELRTRIEEAAASAAPGDLQRAAQAMSEAYVCGGAHAGDLWCGGAGDGMDAGGDGGCAGEPAGCGRGYGCGGLGGAGGISRGAGICDVGARTGDDRVCGAPHAGRGGVCRGGVDAGRPAARARGTARRARDGGLCIGRADAGGAGGGGGGALCGGGEGAAARGAGDAGRVSADVCGAAAALGSGGEGRGALPARGGVSAGGGRLVPLPRARGEKPPA